MNADLLSLSNDIAAAILAGAAQGLAVVAIVWATLKLARRRASAATRHAAWFATLVIVALLPIANFFGPQLGELASKFKPAPVPAQDFSAASELPPLPMADLEPMENLAAAPATTDLRIQTPPLLPAILIAAWMLVALIRFAILGRELIALRRLKKFAAPAPSEFAERFDAILAESRFAREPSLLVADEIASPMVVGYLQPAVVLPAALCESTSASKLDHIFCHELAHLARRDDWANLAQQIISAALFFHPAVYFVSKRLTVEREIACDDHALLKSGARREYALFLTEFAGRMKGRGFAAAPAAWSSNSQLKERIGMILDKTRNCSPRVSRAGVGALAAAAVTVAAIALAAAPRLVLAGPEPAASITTESSADAGAPSAEPQIAIATEVSADVAVTTEPITTTVTVTPAREKDVRAFASVIHAPSAAAAGLPAGHAVVAVAPVPARAAGLPGQPPQAPQPVQLALGHPHPDMAPAPAPRPGRVRADGGNELERRLDRLERMVESLVGREKGPGPDKKVPDGNWGPKPEFNLKFDHNFPGPEFHQEMEKMQRDVQREVERAHREVERAHRESQGMAKRAEEDRGRGEDMRRQSAKARRQALEAQRRAIEKQLEALDRELEREGRGEEKSAKAEAKAENKGNKNSNENSSSDKNDSKGDKPEKKQKEGSDDAPSAENNLRGR